MSISLLFASIFALIDLADTVLMSSLLVWQCIRVKNNLRTFPELLRMAADQLPHEQKLAWSEKICKPKQTRRNTALVPTRSWRKNQIFQGQGRYQGLVALWRFGIV